MSKRECDPDRREIAVMESLLVDHTRGEEDEIEDNYTMPEMDRYDRLYLDSLPVNLL
jgi:hypothetical protein